MFQRLYLIHYKFVEKDPHFWPFFFLLIWEKESEWLLSNLFVAAFRFFACPFFLFFCSLFFVFLSLIHGQGHFSHMAHSLFMSIFKGIPLAFAFTVSCQYLEIVLSALLFFFFFPLYLFLFFNLYSNKTGHVQWDNGKVQDLPHRKDLCSEGWEVVLWVWGCYCRRHESWLDQTRLSARSGTWLGWRSFCFWWL